MTTNFSYKTIIIVASALLLSACLTTQSSASRNSSDIYGTRSSQSADYYLQEANKRQGSEQAIWKLRAASAFAQQDNFARAYQTLISFQPTQLTPDQRNAYYLLKGEAALRQQKGFEAIRSLQAVRNSEQQSRAWNRHHQLLTADALKVNKRYVDAAITRILAADLIDSSSQLERQYQAAWQELSDSPLGALEAKRSRATELDAFAWLDLAITKKRYQNNARLLSEGLKDWGQQYPGHTAIEYLPTETIALRDVEFLAPRKVALIVPLSGRFANVGGAIRDGFVAGYFQSRLDRGELPEIKVYDSANGDSMEQIYQNAMYEGVEMVIGPLLKNNIDQLTRFNQMPIPTLVLNRLSHDFSPNNMYQFGLPVEDEAAQIARFAMRNGQSRAFIINAEPSVGTRAAQAFAETYQELGGTVVQTATIGRNQDPKEAITRLLGVDKIEQRADELQNLLNLPIESSGQGSANADAIFLISDAKRARIIKPYLNYYYAYNLPVYATSDIYNGTSSPRTDNDLSGIKFTDSPWMLATNGDIQRLKKELAKTLPNSRRELGRFFALGHDAFKVIPEIGQLSALPDAAVEGLTGILSMDSQGRIQRQLAWGQYVKGVVRPYNDR
ncbi:MAG: penicillin-binding protein activator [Gammaproteobacteria bacterium]|nr:penicillin-binding protein activator [Gammaproteobacteria bacterium]